MHFAYWLFKARNTHSGFVQFTAFLRQQYLHNCITMLRLYVHCLSCFAFVLPYRAVDPNKTINFRRQCKLITVLTKYITTKPIEEQE